MNWFSTAFVIAAGVGLTGMGLVATRHARTEEQSEGFPLSYRTRMMTEHPAQHRKVLLQFGSAFVRHLVREIERYDPYDPHRRSILNRCYSSLYKTAPWQLRSFLLEPFSPQERARNAINLLSDLGPEAKEAVPALIPLLDDGNVYSAVIATLGTIGPDAKAAVPKLIELLETSEPWVAATLGKIGPAAKAAIPVLTIASTHENKAIRPEAAWALEEITVKESETDLVKRSDFDQ